MNDSIQILNAGTQAVGTQAVGAQAQAAQAGRSAADSIAWVRKARAMKAKADSLEHASKEYVPRSAAKGWLTAPAMELDTCAPAIEYTPIVVPPVVADWHDGLAGSARQVNVGDNSGVLAIIIAIFLAMMLSYRKCRRLFSVLWQEMLGMRRRANAFDDSTGNELGAMALMAVQWCVCTGLLLYSAVAVMGPRYGLGTAPMPAHAFADTGRLMLLMAAYFVMQLAAYWTLGFTFVDATGRRLLVQGFTSSQALLGFALIIPALVGIFYPTTAYVMVLTGAFLYIVARIVFISKGFRIFYQNFGSLLYFILYLCSLEIVPAILVLKIAFSMCITSPTITE